MSMGTFCPSVCQLHFFDIHVYRHTLPPTHLEFFLAAKAALDFTLLVCQSVSQLVSNTFLTQPALCRIPHLRYFFKILKVALSLWSKKKLKCGTQSVEEGKMNLKIEQFFVFSSGVIYGLGPGHTLPMYGKWGRVNPLALRQVLFEFFYF